MNKDYDFKPGIEKTATELAKVIIEEVTNNKDLLIFEDISRTAEEQQKFDKELNEKATDFALSIFKMIASTDMPADYAAYAIEKILAPLNSLKAFIEGHLREIKGEMIARFLEVKSPKSGKYRADCATVADIMLKLNEVQQKTGNNPEDYFGNLPTAPKEEVK